MPRPTNPPTPRFRIADIPEGEFVWEDYIIPFPKPEADRFERIGTKIVCHGLDAEKWSNIVEAFGDSGWVKFTRLGPFFVKDNQMVVFSSGPDAVYCNIEYSVGDESPEGPGSATRMEALTYIQKAIYMQPYYEPPSTMHGKEFSTRIREEPVAEVLIETNIPRLFGNAHMQLFTAYGSSSNGREGRLGAFLVSNGNALRIYDRTHSAVVADVDHDGRFEFVTTYVYDSPGINSVRVRAYKSGVPPGANISNIYIAYETFWNCESMYYSFYGELYPAYLQLSSHPGQLWVYSASRQSDGIVMANLGLLLFKDGEMFPEKMDEYGITFGGEGYFYDPFNPPADWLISASPPPAP
jgi:hypothetical protein